MNDAGRHFEGRNEDEHVAGESPGLAELLGLGAVVAALLLAGLGLGWLVDSLTGTGPVFLLVGLLLGIVGAVAYSVGQFRKYLKAS